MNESKNNYDDYLEFKGWHSLFSYNSYQAKQYKDIFAGLNLKDSNILELGFGSGALMRWLSDQGAIVSGVEIQEELITAAKENSFQVYPSLEHIKTQSFDLIIALDVFEHIEKIHLNDYLVRINQITSSNGMLLARFPNCQSPNGVFTQYGDPTHVSKLSIPIFTHYTSQAGFDFIKAFEGKAVQIYSNNFFVSTFKFIIKSIAKKIIQIGLGSASIPLWADVIVLYKKKT
jgi:2-polyprenyl-3-methyl-5-hydroxy-6-metoxy-1,4-benzoquinol methylase